MSIKGRQYPRAQAGAPLVVFDFDHTLYDGDSGSHLIAWLIRRAWWRRLLALLVAPVAGPMIAHLPTRRRGVGIFVWIGTLGLHRPRDLDAIVDRYVSTHAEQIRRRLLPIGIDVLHSHREAGDRVVIATGAPPELAKAILSFVAHEGVPVVGTELGPRLGGLTARRHCHYAMKMTMLREAGFVDEVLVAYSDSTADLPLLKAARKPVVVNPQRRSIETFRRELPAATPILNWGCGKRGGDTP
ncbi:haloacid dehalogenase-like hydrolase [Lysobacter fragariae]